MDMDTRGGRVLFWLVSIVAKTLAGIILLGWVLVAEAATPAQIDASRDAALAWLIQQQRGDGSWRGHSADDIQATASSLQALRRAGIGGYVQSRGLSWLSNADFLSVDAIARQAQVLLGAGLNAQPQIDKLLAARNRLKAWGAYALYETSFPDTPLAMHALRLDTATYQAEKNRLLSGLCQIILAQKVEGGDAGSWSYLSAPDASLISTGKSAIAPTVYNVLEIAAFMDLGYASRSCSGTSYGLSTVANAGVDWLLAQAKGNNGFGVEETSTPLETALAYLAIAKIRPGDPSLASAHDYLLGTQGSGGDWEDDVFVTSLVAQTFPETTLPDTDGDGLPDGVEAELGTDPGTADVQSLIPGNGDSVLGVTAPLVFYAHLNELFTGALSVSEGVGPYSWELSGFLPAGVTIGASTTASNQISGTPTEAGTYNFTYSVTDADGSLTTGSGQLVVNAPPAIVNPGDQVYDEGTTVSLAVEAGDDNGDTLTYTATGLPPGLTINSGSGEIAGFLDFDALGVYAPVTVTVSDGHDQASANFSWTVNDVDRIPVIDVPPTSQTTREGESVQLTVAAHDPDGQPLTYSYANLPPGLNYSSTTGEVTGQPTYAAAGVYGVTLTVSDGSLQAQHGFNWNVDDVNRAPVLDPLGIVYVEEGSQITVTFTPTDPDGDNLGIDFEKPDFAEYVINGDGSVTVTVSPSVGDARITTYAVKVYLIDYSAATPLTTTRSLLVGVIPEATNVVEIDTGYGPLRLELYGNVAPAAVSAYLNLVQTGELETSIFDLLGPFPVLQGGGVRHDGDSWVSVNEGPLVPNESGIPHEVGTVAMTSHTGLWENFSNSQWFINLNNNSSALGSSNQTVFGRVIEGWNVLGNIVVQPTRDLSEDPIFSALDPSVRGTLKNVPAVAGTQLIALYNVRELSSYARPCNYVGITGEPFHSEFPSPIGLVGPLSYAITAGNLPPGVFLDPVTGEIAGDTTDRGSYAFTYTITDSQFTAESASCTFKVDSPPVIDAIENQISEEGETVAVQIVASDDDPGDVPIYAILASDPLPPGVGMDSVTGLMSGTIEAASAGEYFPVVSVQSGSFTVSRRFNWLVQSADGLVVTSIPNQTMDEGGVLEVPITASGVAADLCVVDQGTLPDFATLTDNGDGTAVISFNPGYDDSGQYAIEITVGDAQSLCAQGGSEPFPPVMRSFTLDVADVNQPPVITNPGDQTNVAGEAVNLSIAATDPEGGDLKYDAANLPAGLDIDLDTGLISGTIGLEAAGTYNTVVAVLDVAASRIYTIGFTWTVTANNVAPVANDDTVVVNEDEVVSFDGRANDTDANGDPLTIESYTPVSHGELTLNVDDTFTYIPSSEYNGTDSFTYTISDGQGGTDTATVDIVVNAVNDPPSVQNPGNQVTAEGANISLPISASDQEGATLSYSATGLPPGLSLESTTGVISGGLSYVAAGTYNVTLTVTDGGESTQVPFTWTVTNVNRQPVAVDDSPSTPEEVPVIISLIANDSDPDGDTVTLASVSQGANGTVADNGDQTVTYTPSQDFDGVDTFTYTVTDGNLGLSSATVSVTVTPTNDAPVAQADSAVTSEDTPVVIAVLSNDSDVDGDTLSVSGITQGANGSVVDNGDGTVTYTPNADYSGGDSFTYTVSDGNGGSDTGTVTVTVAQVFVVPKVSIVDDTGTQDTGATNITVMGTLALFVSDDGVHGAELWASDGTGSPWLVKDLVPGSVGSNPVALTVIGGYLYFITDDGAGGTSVWATAGTEATTSYLGAADPGSQYLTLFGGTLYATTFPLKVVGDHMYWVGDDGVNGSELWVNDGVSSTLIDIAPGAASSSPVNLTAVGSSLYFVANDGTNGYELWITDGTPAGTALVKDIDPGAGGSYATYLAAVGSELYFTAYDGVTGYELWKSDGTEGGTVRVKDIWSGASSGMPHDLVAAGSTLYFVANEGTSGYELWKSDGTEAGTVRVSDVNIGTGSSMPSNLVVAGGLVYFTADDGRRGNELWVTDGTITDIVKDIQYGIGSSNPAMSQSAVTNAGAVYLEADDGIYGHKLWLLKPELVSVVDGDGDGLDDTWESAQFGTLDYTAEQDPDADGLNNIAEFWVGTLPMVADSDGDGMSDGYETGYNLDPNVADAAVDFDLDGVNNADEAPASIEPNNRDSDGDGAFDGEELSLSTDPTNGADVPDGIAKAMGAGFTGGEPSNLATLGDRVYFSYEDANGRELWVSDGTPSGSSMVKDIVAGSGSSNPTALLPIGSYLYFIADDGVGGNRLWATAGTSSTTYDLGALQPGSQYLTLLNNNLYATTFPTMVAGSYIYYLVNDAATGIELWKFDGTTSSLVKDINSGTGSSSPVNLKAVGSTLFFAANDGVNGYELWKTDGTEAGTVMVKDINPGSGGAYDAFLTPLGSAVYFMADNGTNGYELWKSDGTEAGTVMVKDIQPGAGSGAPQSLVAVGNTLYFAANDGSAGLELWQSDGTDAGTVMVVDIQDGAGSSIPQGLLAWNNGVIFTADDGLHGRELWFKDPAVSSPYMVKDIQPIIGSSYPSHIVRGTSTLYFTADDGAAGRELWRWR